MKWTLHRLSWFAVWAVFSSGGLWGQALQGQDDFNDNQPDPAKWASPDFAYGTAQWQERNQRLEFTSDATVDPERGGNYAARGWKLNSAPADRDWEIIVDVRNTLVPGGPDQVASVGLTVANPEYDLDQAVELELYVSTFGGPSTPTRGIYSALYLGENGIDEADSGHLGLTDASLRLHFAAATKILTASYDSNGAAGGYFWTTLGSYGLGGSGGTIGNTGPSRPWTLTNETPFAVGIYGYAADVTVTSGTLTADNFQASSVQNEAPPRLSIQREENLFRISWPAAATGYQLLSRTNLLTGSWSPLSATVTTANGTNSVTVPVSGSGGFFQLAR